MATAQLSRNFLAPDANSSKIPSEISSQTWARFSARLRREFGETVYSSWLSRLQLERIEKDRAFLSVPTKFLKSWIQAHYFEQLSAILRAEMPEIRDISLDLRLSIAPAPAQPVIPRGSAAPAAEIAVASAEIDRRMRFAQFSVGSSNQLAFAAAREAAGGRSGAASPFNPLYLHSGVGLGKTHLLQAIAQAAAEGGRKAAYLSAEKFMVEFVSALKSQTSLSFKERLRGLDLLAIDDVQFLQGKSVQHEFCHTLNALIDAGRQVVIAADRIPAELENLDERVRSRFAGGLCVEIQPLDETLRREILRSRIAAARAAHPDFDLSPEVVDMVVSAIRSNGRDLDGALNRLLAHTVLARSPLTLDAAEAAIRDLVQARAPRRVKIEQIQKTVAEHFKVSRGDMVSARRSATIVLPRQIAMYLCKALTPRSLPEIGRHFGGRDHTTVLHAIRKIEALLVKEPSLGRDLDGLKKKLTD